MAASTMEASAEGEEEEGEGIEEEKSSPQRHKVSTKDAQRKEKEFITRRILIH